ncbi:MAG: cephalosporin hydroxylase [Pirellulales bacterium]|jgi:cephalosporin hydroxylase|nr:cephalosporin hydroxylase [Pirellulales bacterium]
MNETNSGHVHDDTHTDYHAAKAMAEARMQRGVWQDRFAERFVPFASRTMDCGLSRQSVDAIAEGKNYVSYRGIGMAKDPFDMVLYPILLHEVAPATVIELGAYTGASALWMADTLATMEIKSRVISVDIDLSLVDEKAKGRSDIEFREGDCNAIEELFPPEMLHQLPHPLVLIDDAHVNIAGVYRHFHEHALREGDYLVIEDTIPWMPGAFGPINEDAGTGQVTEWGDWKWREILKFFREHGDDYRVDRYYTDFFGLNATWNWNGFVRRGG